MKMLSLETELKENAYPGRADINAGYLRPGTDPTAFKKYSPAGTDGVPLYLP